jgi:Glycosyl hydrolases family 16
LVNHQHNRYHLYSNITFTLSAAFNINAVTTAAFLSTDGSFEFNWEIAGRGFDGTGILPTVVTTQYRDNSVASNASTFHLMEDAAVNETWVSHTYNIDWNPDRIVWRIDGTMIRQLDKKNVARYPDIPSQFRLSIWYDTVHPINDTSDITIFPWPFDGNATGTGNDGSKTTLTLFQIQCY